MAVETLPSVIRLPNESAVVLSAGLYSCSLGLRNMSSIVGSVQALMLAMEHDSKQEGLSMQLHDAQQLLTVEHLAQVRTYANTCLIARNLTGTWKSSEGPLPRHASSFSVAHC